MAGKKKEVEERFVNVPYCQECKALAIKCSCGRTEYGIASYEIDDDGEISMINYDTNNAEEDFNYCDKCGKTLGNEILVPYSVFKRLRKYIEQRKVSNVPFDIRGREPEDIKPEEVKDLLFESLI